MTDAGIVLLGLMRVVGPAGTVDGSALAGRQGRHVPASALAAGEASADVPALAGSVLDATARDLLPDEDAPWIREVRAELTRLRSTALERAADAHVAAGATAIRPGIRGEVVVRPVAGRRTRAMINSTMYGLVGRNAAVVAATVAAVLLGVQLSSSGVHGYGFSDILSVLLVAAPMAARAVRPPPQRRGSPRASDDGGDVGGAQRRPRPFDTEAGRAVEGMVARGIAVVVAVGAWLLAFVLVLLQAWPPVVSAMIVFVLAAGGLPSAADAAVQASPDDHSH